GAPLVGATVPWRPRPTPTAELKSRFRARPWVDEPSSSVRISASATAIATARSAPCSLGRERPSELQRSASFPQGCGRTSLPCRSTTACRLLLRFGLERQLERGYPATTLLPLDEADRYDLPPKRGETCRG